ncbi:NAD(P)/FAD-dependent oxidoreductase [Nocardioides maradonensis]
MATHLPAPAISTGRPTHATSIDTVVIGAGQAGLAMGYRLRRTGRSFVILDGDERIGDCWRRRYDSLRLFSLPRYASLPGWRIPVRGYATRDQFADYLEAYARRFELPVRCGERVSSVDQEGDRFRVTSTTGTFLAANVVVATGAHRRATVPALADDLDPAIRQLTSTDYRNPGQLAPGPVLVVGAGNSGTDVALDAAAAGHEVLLAGRHPGQVPFDIDRRSGRAVVPVVMFVFRHVLTLRTPMGRRLSVESEGHGVGLVRNKVADLDAAGVRRIGRIERVVDGRPAGEDGTGLDVGTVVWCTGTVADHRFLELPGFDDRGRPLHERGLSPIPGLAFLGLPFQYALASQQIQGVDRDARYLVKRLRPAARVAA